VIVLIDLCRAGISHLQRQSLARQSDGESVGDPVKGKQLEEDEPHGRG
jgi:hypothetical protein